MSLSVKDVDFGEQNVIYVTSGSDKEKYGVDWTIPSTENLLKYLKKYIVLFERGEIKRKKQLYEYVSAALEENGQFYSGSQCENKWKSLKRSYFAKIGKSKDGRQSSKKLYQKTPFERQIEDILKIERPHLKKEIETYDMVNLNIPPGFAKVEPESSDEEDDQIPEYTDKDEELVQMVLREPSPEDSKDNIETMEYDSNHNDNNSEEHNYSYVLDSKSSNRLVEEVMELKKIVKKNLDANTEVLRNHNATHEQILTYLDTLEKKDEEKLELKRRKLDKQDEIIHQMKIQNSLIAKLIQKLAGNNSNK